MRFAPLLIILAMIGCGSDSDDNLSTREQETIGQAQADVIIYGVTGEAKDREAAQHGVRTLIAVHRSNPGVKVDKRTIEQMMQDVASQLDATDPDMAAELDRALAGS